MCRPTECKNICKKYTDKYIPWKFLIIQSPAKKKLYTSLNRRRMKSNKDRIDFKQSRNSLKLFWCAKYDDRIFITVLQQFIAKQPEIQRCK